MSAIEAQSGLMKCACGERYERNTGDICVCGRLRCPSCGTLSSPCDRYDCLAIAPSTP
jgi:hypothetical protein